jgi:F0F1-type ATP synthase assembly protein I
LDALLINTRLSAGCTTKLGEFNRFIQQFQPSFLDKPRKTHYHSFMKRRYISDESYAGIMIGVGIGILLAIWLFHVKDDLGMISHAGDVCIFLGGGLLSIVRDRKRLGLDVPAKREYPARSK